MAEDGYSGSKGVPLCSEDNARLRKLNEEIAGRITEMALIVSRTLELDAALPVLSFTQSVNRSEQDDGVDVASHEMTLVDGSHGCWDLEQEVCCEGPCPC